SSVRFVVCEQPAVPSATMIDNSSVIFSIHSPFNGPIPDDGNQPRQRWAIVTTLFRQKVNGPGRGRNPHHDCSSESCRSLKERPRLEKQDGTALGFRHYRGNAQRTGLVILK